MTSVVSIAVWEAPAENPSHPRLQTKQQARLVKTIKQYGAAPPCPGRKPFGMIEAWLYKRFAPPCRREN